MLIGLVGHARSGKDTAAGILTTYHPKLYCNTNCYAFAKPIKEHVNALFGWDWRHANGPLKEVVDPFWGFSPRHAYQTFGTEWARKHLRQDIWLKLAEKKLAEMPNTIITDVRFVNEANWILSHGGFLIKITRHSDESIGTTHESESQIDQIKPHVEILNMYTLKDFEEDLLGAVNDFMEEEKK